MSKMFIIKIKKNKHSIKKKVLQGAWVIFLLSLSQQQVVSLNKTTVFNNYKEKQLVKNKAISQDKERNNIFHSPYFHSPKTRLPVLANGQSGITSNASNFHGGWNASVDPRTGTASFSLKTGGVLYDNGRAHRNLVLSWGGSPVPGGPDPFGLGTHWQWNVGIEQPASAEVAGHRTTALVTGDGHAFTMVSDRNTSGQIVWHPLRHKLHDVVISGHPGDWTITMATGVREHLKNGYEDWESSQDGHRIYFYYDRSGENDTVRHLLYLCAHPLTSAQVKGDSNACVNQGVRLTYDNDHITLKARQTLILYRGKSGNGLSRIAMPPLDSEALSRHEGSVNLTFEYDNAGNRPWLIHKVTYPTGMSTTFLYNGESRKSHLPYGIPAGINHAWLPVVTEEITQSGNADVPDKRLYYHYGSAKNSHNFTGYQGDGTVTPGRDNLFDRPDDYTYNVTVDNGLTRTTTIYNKYHLPLKVLQHEDKSNISIAESDQSYLPWRHTTFSMLSPQYSLAIGSGKILRALTGRTTMPARVVEARRYDQAGRVIWQQDAWGRQTFTRYCPQEGDGHCPARTPGQPVSNRPEQVLMVPAKNMPADIFPRQVMVSETPARPVEVVFDYTRMKSKIDPKVSFWQVAGKSIATLAPGKTRDLKPGDVLPFPDEDELLNRTRYGYETRSDSPFYGELSRLTVTRFPPHVSHLAGHLLRLSKTVVPASPMDVASFIVTHHIDKATGTRSTTLAIAPNGHGEEKANGLSQLENTGGLKLGTTVYSMFTGQRMAASDTLKQFKTTWGYDRWNRLISKTVTPAHGGQPHTTHVRWCVGKGETIMIITVFNGSQQKTVYGSGGEVLSRWHRFSDTTDWIPDSATGYTVTGKPAWHTVYMAADNDGKTEAFTTTFGYDALNRPVWTRTPDGMVNIDVRNDPALEDIQYSVATGNALTDNTDKKTTLTSLLTVTRANLLGKPVARYVFPTNPNSTRAGKPLYDEATRKQLTALIAAMAKVSSLRTTGNNGLLPLAGTNGLLSFIRHAIDRREWLTHTTFAYNGTGHRIRQRQGNGAVTRWQWRRGDLVATIAPDGRVIHDTFNVQGKKVARCVQPVGGTQCHSLGTRAFDPAGNLLWQADEYGHVIRHRYDGDGRETDRYTPDGHHFQWRYSDLGMTEALLDGQVYLKISYDPVTWRVTDREDRISHLRYTYDKKTGTLVSVTHSAPATLKSVAGIYYPVGKETLTLDRYLHPVTFTSRNGYRFSTVHDVLGRVTEIRVQPPGASASITLTKTIYDFMGRVATVSNGKGIIRTFDYNTVGQVKSTTDRWNHQTLLKQTYTYDPDTGSILNQTRTEGKLSATQVFTYDIDNNLKTMACHVTGQPNVTSPLCPRDTDLAGSKLKTPPVIFSQHYDFDHWNNITRVTEILKTDKGKRVTKTTRYNYADTNPNAKIPEAYDPHRMLALSSTWSTRGFSTPPLTLTYDTMGRIIRDAAGNTLHYNAFGHQDCFVNRQTGEITRYTYDSDGHQIAVQPFNAKGQALQSPLYLFYAGNSVSSQSQKDKKGINHTATELGGVARGEDGRVNRWYLQDYKGDVIVSLDGRGKWLQDNLYSPYGMSYNRLNNHNQALSGTLKIKNPGLLLWRHFPGFDGQVRDPSTGYQFLGGGYRAYNPVYRHFMAMDSISPFTRVNGYGFGANNPVMNTDPTGHMPSWAGYLMGGLGITMSIGLGFLMPIAAIGAGAGMTAGAATIIGGAVMGGIGAASGSLQIASTKHPFNKKLAIANASFGLAGNAMAMVGGGFGFVAGITNAIVGVGKVTSALIMGSGVMGAISGATGSASASMGVATLANSDLGFASGYGKAIEVLNDISMAGMALASVFSFAGDILGGGKLIKGAIESRQSEPESVITRETVAQMQANHLEQLRGEGWNRSSALYRGDIEGRLMQAGVTSNAILEFVLSHPEPEEAMEMVLKFATPFPKEVTTVLINGRREVYESPVYWQATFINEETEGLIFALLTPREGQTVSSQQTSLINQALTALKQLFLKGFRGIDLNEDDMYSNEIFNTENIKRILASSRPMSTLLEIEENELANTSGAF